MAIKESNKNLSITVPKEMWDELNEIAKRECRSVSKQAFLFLIKGMQSEGKRD